MSAEYLFVVDFLEIVSNVQVLVRSTKLYRIVVQVKRPYKFELLVESCKFEILLCQAAACALG